MKTIAIRCTKLYFECPQCGKDLECIPLNNISDIEKGQIEKFKCPKCKTLIEIVKII